MVADDHLRCVVLNGPHREIGYLEFLFRKRWNSWMWEQARCCSSHTWLRTEGFNRYISHRHASFPCSTIVFSFVWNHRKDIYCWLWRHLEMSRMMTTVSVKRQLRILMKTVIIMLRGNTVSWTEVFLIFCLARLCTILELSKVSYTGSQFVAHAHPVKWLVSVFTMVRHQMETPLCLLDRAPGLLVCAGAGSW